MRGKLLQDAWFAALAIDHDCEWITHDRDYARFPGDRPHGYEALVPGSAAVLVMEYV